MAISYVGASVAAATFTAAVTGQQAGDILIVMACRVGSAVPPTLPTGWLTLDSLSSSPSPRIGWKVAASAAETSSNWTNATNVMMVAYRGQATNKVPIINAAIDGGTNTVASYSNLLTQNRLQNPLTSWVIGLGFVNSTTSTIETPPTGLTLRFNNVGASTEFAVHDSNGVSMPSWSTRTVALGASLAFGSITLELMAEFSKLNNYMGVDTGTGMSTGEKIR